MEKKNDAVGREDFIRLYKDILHWFKGFSGRNNYHAERLERIRVLFRSYRNGEIREQRLIELVEKNLR